MTTWLPRCFALLVLVLPFVPVGAAADEKEIPQLIKQLGDDEFEKREAATIRLKEIGAPALDAVTKATTSRDPEVRRRAEIIVAVLEDKLYPELCLTGHTGEVWTVAVSADGKRLLTSGTDKTLRLWDTATGKCVQVFEGHTQRVIGAALSPDGKRVLSGSGDKTVRLWDATTGKELRQMTGHTKEVTGVAFGPKGQAISGSHDQTMRLWDLDSGKNAGVFTHTDVLRNVAYSDKAELVATCGNGTTDWSIRLWNLGSGKEIGKFTGHTGGVPSVCFSPDGKRLLSASEDGTLRLWDVESGKELRQIKAHDFADCAAFSPDGKRLVSGGYEDHCVTVWDATTGKALRKYEGHTNIVLGVAFFPDGKRIVSTSRDGTARVWRVPR